MCFKSKRVSALRSVLNFFPTTLLIILDGKPVPGLFKIKYSFFRICPFNISFKRTMLLLAFFFAMVSHSRHSFNPVPIDLLTIFTSCNSFFNSSGSSDNQWKNQKIATLRVVYDQELVGEYDLFSSKEVKKVNFISRLIKSINYLIWGDV